ncbi:O-antigen ligase family protein [Gammaproteobacteria bacterium]|nr:O-antigen ligase family protein [Gammaproteobacteria bacterium]
MICFLNRHKLALENINFLFLLLLIISLPTQETPKLIFWGIFVVSSLLLYIINPNKKKWDLLDTLIICWMFSGIIVAYFAGLHHKEWSGSTDLLIFTSVLLIFKKCDTPYKNINIIFNIILLSTLLASMLAIWQLVVLNNREFIEFHSVGHVNHTAIYLSLSLAVIISLLYTRWKSSTIAGRLFYLAVYSSISITLVLTNSRAAILASFLLLLCCAWLYRKQILLSLTLLSLLLAFIGGNYLVSGEGVINKQIDQVERGIFFQARIKIWRGALLAWQQYPVFGVGIKNYPQIDIDKLLDWCSKSGDSCHADDYQPYAHAHSVYINTLAERGIFGLLVVFLNILMLIFLLYKYRPNKSDTSDYAMLWTAASGVIFLNLVIGIFNTSLHHEHALLSMVVIGLWLGKTPLRTM